VEALAGRYDYKAGPLSVTLTTAGDVSRICYAGIELCRGLQFLARDAQWGTLAAASTPSVFVVDGIECMVGDQTADRSAAPTCEIDGLSPRTITYKQRLGHDAFDLTMKLVLEPGNPSTPFATLKLEATATALRPVSTARTGFVVLHPLTETVWASVPENPACAPMRCPIFSNPHALWSYSPIFLMRTAGWAPR